MKLRPEGSAKFGCWSIVAFFMALFGVVDPLAVPLASADVTFVVYAAGGVNPSGIVAGPDGAMWIVLADSDAIARMDLAGNVVLFPLAAGAGPGEITTGPDGALWFTEHSAGRIGRITTSGVITEFGLPVAGSAPGSITLGPDGNLWFTERRSDHTGAVGRITASGAVTEFPIQARPNGITAGPDGNLWLTTGTDAPQGYTRHVARMTPSGAFTAFAVPQQSNPNQIRTGPDANLWFTDTTGNQIGRMDTNGALTEFTIPVPFTQPTGITVGPDGNLWFAQNSQFSPGSGIGRITPAGEITEFPLQYKQLAGIAAGPDGNLWVTDTFGSIIKVDLDTPQSPTTTTPASEAAPPTSQTAPPAVPVPAQPALTG